MKLQLNQIKVKKDCNSIIESKLNRIKKEKILLRPQKNANQNEQNIFNVTIKN